MFVFGFSFLGAFCYPEVGQGAAAVWSLRVLWSREMGVGVFRAEGHIAVKQRGEESLVEELWDITRKMRKEMGQKKGTRKVRSNPHLSGFLLKSCSAGWQMGSGEQDSQGGSQNMCGMGWG